MYSKKLLTIIVCMSICLLNNCYADDYVFSYRNDIRFGDSMETVIEKDNTITRDTTEPYILRNNNITLSGIKNSFIYYTFEHDKLVAIQLLYGDIRELNAGYHYESIHEGLIRKYGLPEKMKKMKYHIMVV